ncbi:MAG TPA: RDD family protein [Caulobacteraceae bacterium]|nr:RDD family protein [Caulobacteraceae bacterium]
MTEDTAQARRNEAFARFLARSVDSIIALPMSVLAIILITALTGMSDALAEWSRTSVVGGLVVNFGLIIAGHMLYDLACTRMYGRTPGKWLMGLRIVSNESGKPTLKAAAIRTFLVWTVGLGLAIPFVTLVAGIFGLVSLERNGVTFWDRKAGLKIEKRPVGPLRWGAALLIWAASMILLLGFTLSGPAA